MDLVKIRINGTIVNILMDKTDRNLRTKKVKKYTTFLNNLKIKL